jgi:hypothetical protein
VKLLLVLIQTQPELLALCERLQGAPIICLDTEFAREGRYFAQPGTIQLAAGAELALIDAVAIRDFSCLKPVLANSEVVKVFHAGEQDLEILYRLLGCPVTPVFDTQIAAAFLGLAFSLPITEYSYVLLFAAYINSFMAVFNLIPFGVLDGYKLFLLNKKVWITSFIPSVILAAISGWIIFVG